MNEVQPADVNKGRWPVGCLLLVLVSLGSAAGGCFVGCIVRDVSAVRMQREMLGYEKVKYVAPSIEGNFVLMDFATAARSLGFTPATGDDTSWFVVAHVRNRARRTVHVWFEIDVEIDGKISTVHLDDVTLAQEASTIRCEPLPIESNHRPSAALTVRATRSTEE